MDVPRTGKIQWTLADVKTVALNMKRGVPVAVTQALTEGWEGGAIIQLEDTISRPTAADLVVNHVFLRPFARQCPAKVPSAFFAADVFLFLPKSSFATRGICSFSSNKEDVLGW